MFLILKKEIAGYFSTPFGFIFMGIFLLLSGIIFTTYNLIGGGGDLNGMFGLFSNISFMIFPVLTIKMFADERRFGIEPFLLNSRLSSTQIVLGKYLAACFVFLAALAVTARLRGDVADLRFPVHERNRRLVYRLLPARRRVHRRLHLHVVARGQLRHGSHLLIRRAGRVWCWPARSDAAFRSRSFRRSFLRLR